MAKPPSKPNDFDIDEIVKKNMEGHTKDMEALGGRVLTLEEKFGSSSQLAATLKDACDESKKMEELFLANFVCMLSKNESARSEIQKLIKNTDRDYVATTLRRWGTWIGAFFLFIFAQISIEVISYLKESLTTPSTPAVQTDVTQPINHP